MNKGELKHLDNHRLMCGDATNKEDVNKLLNGAKIDLLLTDPPYGINIVKTNKIGGTGGGGSDHSRGCNWRSEPPTFQGTVGTGAKPGFKEKKNKSYGGY